MEVFRPDSERHRQLLRLEEGVWNALVKGDAQADLRALHPAFLGVYASGFSDRAGHVGQLDQGPSVSRFRLSDIKIGLLGDEHGVITYRAIFQRSSKDRPEEMLVSSIWQCDDGVWSNILSQDTPVPDHEVG